jgi:hypothetical protein
MKKDAFGFTIENRRTQNMILSLPTVTRNALSSVIGIGDDYWVGMTRAEVKRFLASYKSKNVRNLGSKGLMAARKLFGVDSIVDGLTCPNCGFCGRMKQIKRLIP